MSFIDFVKSYKYWQHWYHLYFQGLLCAKLASRVVKYY